jgi:hypothetical protein
MTRDPLWDEVDRAFHAHWLPKEDQTATVNLNRIAGKCVLTRLQPETCTVHQETLTSEELKRLKLYDQSTTPPALEREPIIVVEIDGVRHVIDGRRRVMKWIREGSTQSRTAIIMVPKQWRKWPLDWTTNKPTRPGWYWYRPTSNVAGYPVKVFDAKILYVWPINDRVTEKKNVTMRLSDCSGEFAGPLEALP